MIIIQLQYNSQKRTNRTSASLYLQHISYISKRYFEISLFFCQLIHFQHRRRISFKLNNFTQFNYYGH